MNLSRQNSPAISKSFDFLDTLVANVKLCVAIIRIYNKANFLKIFKDDSICKKCQGKEINTTSSKVLYCVSP